MELVEEDIFKLEEEDQEYAQFYREEVKEVYVYCLYIDQQNELKFGRKQLFQINNGVLPKNELVYLIKKNMEYNDIKYKPFSVIKYNFILEPRNIKMYLKDPKKYNFLRVEKSIENIKWYDTIPCFMNLNSLYILYYEPHKIKEGRHTKKIYIRKKKLNRKKQTKRKQLKAEDS